MPLAVRYIESTSAPSIPLLGAVTGNQIQALGVQNLACVIRQLGSLAKHAESIMGDITEIVVSYHHRTLALEERTRRLEVEIIPYLDPEREVLDGFEIPHPSLQFKSSQRIDQRLLTQQLMPLPLVEQYNATSYAPALHLFTPLWEDGRDALHLFSNPDYFFDQWRQNMMRAQMSRKSTGDILSPTRDSEGRKPNGVVRRQKSSTKKDHSTVWKEPTRARAQTTVKRGRSFKRQSYHGSTQSLQNTGFSRRKPPVHPGLSSFQRNTTKSRSLRASFRRKNNVKLKQESLSKATAAAFDHCELEHNVEPLSPLSPLEDNSGEFSRHESTPKRQSFIRRSFSLRKERRTRSSRSLSPRLPIPTATVTDGSMVMHTVDAEKEKIETSKLSTLSKYHMEKLELGSTGFETCLAVDSSKKNSSTFQASPYIQARSISPFPRRRTNSKSQSEAPDPDFLMPRHERSQTFSGGSPYSHGALPRARSPLMNRVMSNERPVSTPPFESMFPVFQAYSHSTLHSSSNSLSQPQPVEPYAVTTIFGSHNDVRSKARRPAPPKPPRTDLMGLTRVNSPGSGNTPTRKHPPPPSPSFASPAVSLSTKSSRTSSPVSAPVEIKDSPPYKVTDVNLPVTAQVERKDGPPYKVMDVNLPITAQVERKESPPYKVMDVNLPITAQVERKDGPPYTVMDVNLPTFLPYTSAPVENENYAGTRDNESEPIQNGLESADHVTQYSANTVSSDFKHMSLNRSISPLFTTPTHIQPIKLPIPIPSEKQKEPESSSFIPMAAAPPPPKVPPAVPLRHSNPTTLQTASGPSPSHVKPKPPKVKQGSLYISPRKMSQMELHIPPALTLSTTLEVDEEPDFNKRSSQILKAGGVSDSGLNSSRDDLLSAIRMGLQLKKVEKEEKKRANMDSALWDVAAILERRFALMDSESEEEDFEDEDWDDV